MPGSEPGNLLVCRVRIVLVNSCLFSGDLSFLQRLPSFWWPVSNESGLMGGIAFREQLFFLPVSCAGRRNGFPDPLPA
jgi:hypothetical protein